MMVAILFVFLCSTYNVYSQDLTTLRFVKNGVGDTSQLWSSGIVQIYYYGEWGNICDDISFGSNAADVICHQLSYSGASSHSNTGVSSIYGTDSAPTAWSSISCLYSNYVAISQCSFSTNIPTLTCGDNHDVIVTCYTTRIWNSPSTGDIRLTGGNYSNEGLLEIYCNGEWGTVCDDTFRTRQAQVACAQLGFNSYTNYNHLTLSGSSQSIWLDSLSSYCSNTLCLASCQGCPASEIHDCSHDEDITLECTYNSRYSKIITTTSTYCKYTDHTATATAVSVAGIVATLACCILCIAILTAPLCISVCCCWVTGWGAASVTLRRRRRGRPVRTVVIPPAPVPIASTVSNLANDGQTYIAPPPPYSQQLNSDQQQP